MGQDAQQNQVSQIELAYLAGYFDGEGCISFAKALKKYPYLTITLVTADLDSLKRFEAAFGGDVRPVKWGNKPHKRQLYFWQKGGQNAQMILLALYPFLSAKKQIAELALRPNFTGGHGKPLTKEEFDLRLFVASEVSKINNRVTV